MKPLKFEHQVIDADPPGAEHDITLLFDINGNGRTDIFIAGKSGEVFWYANPGWERHVVANAPQIEAGGVVVDINGDGRLDVVAGQQLGGNELYWFENPVDPTKPWTRRLIENRFEKYHDQAVGDIDGDGELELLIVSQRSGVLAYYDIPRDPTVEPWPQECCHVIVEDMHGVEGLAIVDIDHDGEAEVLAGTNIFKRTGDGWERTRFADNFVKTRVIAADINGDGAFEIVVAEGESNPGRLAWCAAPDWTPHVLKDDLFHPHSIEVLDFDGSGASDIFVGEMGLGRNDNPRLFVYRNKGRADFDETVISEGIPTHEAKAADLTGNGLPDIVGKPYNPEKHIDVWFNRSCDR